MSPSKVQLKKESTFEYCGELQTQLASIPEFDVPEVDKYLKNTTLYGWTGGDSITVSLHCENGEGSMKSLAVGHDSHKIFLAGINANDEHQQWDLLNNNTYGRIKGDEKRNYFVLVNRATGLALWRSRGEGDYNCNLSLMKFDGRYQDDSALWKEGQLAKHGLRRIYAADNECYLNIDDANSVLLQEDEKRFLKFGGSKGKIWKIVHLP